MNYVSGKHCRALTARNRAIVSLFIDTIIRLNGLVGLRLGDIDRGTLHMTNKYASLTIDHLRKSHERHSPLRADTGRTGDVLGTGYWDE